MKKIILLFLVLSFSETYSQNTGINTHNPRALLDIVHLGNNNRTKGLSFPLLESVNDLSGNSRDGMVSFFKIPSNYGFYFNYKGMWYPILNATDLQGNLSNIIYESDASGIKEIPATCTAISNIVTSAYNFQIYSCKLNELAKFDINFKNVILPTCVDVSAIRVGKQGNYNIVVNATILKERIGQGQTSEFELYICKKVGLNSDVYNVIASSVTNVPNVGAGGGKTYSNNTINVNEVLNVDDHLYVILKFINANRFNYSVPANLPISISLTYLD